MNPGYENIFLKFTWMMVPIVINSFRGDLLVLLFLLSTEHRGLSRNTKMERKDRHNAVFTDFLFLWVSFSLHLYLSMKLTFGLTVPIWMLASLLGVSPHPILCDRGTQRTITGGSTTHTAVFGKEAEEFPQRRTLGEGSCAFQPLGHDSLNMSPAPSYSLNSRSPLKLSRHERLAVGEMASWNTAGLSLTLGVLFVLSKIISYRSKTNESLKQELVNVYCAYAKKTVCKVGPLKPEHGMKFRSVLLENSLQSEKAVTFFFTVIGYNIRIFLNYRELVSGYITLSLGTSLSFAYDFQRHKQEMTQVKLVLQK